MPSATPEERYVDDIARVLPEKHPLKTASDSASRGNQRVYYSGLHRQDALDLTCVFRQYDEDNASHRTAVCIIENISREWIGALGVAWSIEPDFFVQYATNATGEDLWDAIMGKEAKADVWTAWKDSSVANRHTPHHARVRNQCHIEGVFEHVKPESPHHLVSRFPRRSSYHTRWGWQANTKISYYRVSAFLYLFLVDPPSAIADCHEDELFPARLTLNVPFTRNIKGLPIPQTFSTPYFSAFEFLHTFLTYGNHMSLLHDHVRKDEAVDCVTFSYHLACSLWLTNIHWLEYEIHKIAFKNIRKPSVLINDRLHDRRHDLTLLRDEVQSIRNWIKPEMDQYLDSMQITWLSPKEAVDKILDKADSLTIFLMDTFQILMSSISVLDAQTSLEQARLSTEEAKRSTTLTQLAAVYLPLSLATGIFGMNVKEINDSPLSVWVVLVTLAIIAIGTAVLLLGTGTIRRATKHRLQRTARLIRRPYEASGDTTAADTGFESQVDATKS